MRTLSLNFLEIAWEPNPEPTIKANFFNIGDSNSNNNSKSEYASANL